MILASEDSVSEVLLYKLSSLVRPDVGIHASLGGRGRGYLKTRARELNRAARSIPVFMLIDLDSRSPCPVDVLTIWLHGAPETNMLFRVAVMEVESWILADRGNCSHFLGVPTHRIPTDTDAIDNPKEFLVDLARRSRKREIREELVPAPGSIIPIGPAYNAQLSGFVTTQWDPNAASLASHSLRRAIERLGEAFGRS